MGLLIAKQGASVVLMPEGQLDTNSSPEAERLLMERIEAGETRFVIDFSKTKYISSAGLRVILKSMVLLKEKGGGVVLCNGNEQVEEILEISGFSDLLSHFKSLEDALDASKNL